MKKILCLILAFIGINAFSQTGTKNFIDQNYIEVSGTAEMYVNPDMIYLKIVLDEEDSKNKKDLVEMENNMLRVLKKNGIDTEKDLKIKDLSSNYRKKVLASGQIVLSKEYQLLVHSSKDAFLVFTELEKIGISNIDIEKLDHSKIVEYRKETRMNAVKAAKEKATYLAEAIDQEVGKAMLITEINNNIYTLPRNSKTVLYNYTASQEKSTPDEFIEFKQIKLSYTFDCKFELK